MADVSRVGGGSRVFVGIAALVLRSRGRHTARRSVGRRARQTPARRECTRDRDVSPHRDTASSLQRGDMSLLIPTLLDTTTRQL